ncbi:MAG: hypothetical protein B6I20_04335 [Bacteroidetes bacterium 4572_117]|nr:MAG: hypothetical protein B6I20_04335 [Bacteroidetes bacterium 4572_117]
MANTKTPLESDKMFHIYNHAVGNDNFFNSDENYSFFLLKLKEYLQNYIDIYAYCLMPNHFHIIIKVKREEDVINEYRKKKSIKESRIKELNFVPNVVSRQFGHLFNSYAQAYNKENSRMGSLFTNRFKREPIEDEVYLKTVITYTHKNPVEAGFVKMASEWKFSSYNSIISKKETLLKRSEVINLFDDIENFIYCHR